MMRSLFKFFAERHLLATLITLMILIVGFNALMTIKRDLFPKVELNQVMITTFYPGASPEDVELSVTNKIESFIQPISGVSKFTSYSIEDMSLIYVEIVSDLSKKRVEEVVQEIRNGVAQVRGLPSEVTDAPQVVRMRTSEIPVIEIGIASDRRSYASLREQARILEKKIKAVPGVARLDKTGYRAREIQIAVNPGKMKQYQLSLNDIVYAIQARNIRSTGGTLESYAGEKNLMTLSQFKHPREVGDVIVRTQFEGPSIRVKDLALIHDSFEEEKTFSRMNGRPAISFTVYKTEKADIMRTVQRLRTLMIEEKDILPEDVDVLYSNNYARYVEAGYDVVKNNALMGIVLVLFILTLFLNLRTAFWVALGIPVSVLGTIAVLPYFGVSLDVITLSVMILVLGILVDDAIVISENINRRMEMGDSPVTAAVNGLNEVAGPVFTSVLTTLLAFAPMFFIPGEEGKFIFPIPLVIALTLGISLIESIFALPAHIIHGRKAGKSKKQNWFERVRQAFERLLNALLKWRYIWVLCFLTALGGAIWFAREKMEVIVFPNTGAEELAIYCDLPPQASLNQTSEKMKEVEALINELPKGEVESFVTRIGTFGDGALIKNAAVIQVTLTPFSTRHRTAEEIAQQLRGQAAVLTGYTQFYIDLEESGPAAAQPVRIHIKGSDFEMRDKLARDMMQFMASMGTLQDIRRNDRTGKDEIDIRLNYDKMARLGLTAADVAGNVRASFDGETVTQVRYGEEDVKFKVMLDKKVRQNERYLKQMVIPNQQGRMIPLKEIAQFVTRPGATDCRHENGERVITLSAELMPGKTTAQKASAAILEAFKDCAKTYPGMSILSEGEAERTQKTLNNTLRALLIAVIGIYFLMMIQFNSLVQPLQVMAAIPFGFAGIVLVFALHHEPVSFMGMLGFIGLCGVVVNDSIVLVNHLNQQIKISNLNLRTLVARGTSHRLRAILLTTITTAAGLLPLAYGIGGADPYNAPMALALGWGLLAATPLTLLLIPSLYLIGNDVKRVMRCKDSIIKLKERR